MEYRHLTCGQASPAEFTETPLEDMKPETPVFCGKCEYLHPALEFVRVGNNLPLVQNDAQRNQ